MAWYRNLRMTPKLVGSFILMAVLTTVVGGAGYLGLRTQNSSLNTLTTISVPAVALLQGTELDLADAIRYSRGAVLATNKADIASYATKAEAAVARVQADWKTNFEVPFDDDYELNLSNQTTPLLQQWVTLDTQVVALARQNTTAADLAATRLSTGAEKTVANQVTANLALLLASNQKYMGYAQTSAHNAYVTATDELLIVLVLAVLLAIGMGWLTARSIVRPLAGQGRCHQRSRHLHGGLGRRHHRSLPWRPHRPGTRPHQAAHLHQQG